MNLLSLDLCFFLAPHKTLPQPEQLKEELEKSIEDVMKGRGEVQILPKGTIPATQVGIKTNSDCGMR